MDGPVCDNCSTPLPVGSRYCNACGTPVPGQEAVMLAARPSPGGVSAPTDLRQALQMATAGEYEVHHELGRGGMGSVFLAREIGLDRLVAIKVLPPSLMFDEGLVERFKREARMVAKLHHPNIIPVYRVHHSHNLAFYTMHFVPGRSLSDLMAGGRLLSLEEMERVMLEAAAGLGYAHKRGVIHRDVKPANILLDAEGHVHLTDFGIAKALIGNTQLTNTGAVIGTPQYMAPEQCEGRIVDGRADQYALAVVGYQLLVGTPPFESNSVKELLYHHLFTPPRPINAVRPDAPLPLRDAIHKALSKDPIDRFDSMEDFRMAIQGKGPPVFVRWLDGPSRSAKDGDRRRDRRSTDLPTTKRLPEVPWASGSYDEVAQLNTSVYRRALAALAVTVLIIGAVGALALSRGEGLPGWPEAGHQNEVGSSTEASLVETANVGADPVAARPFPGGAVETEAPAPAPSPGRLVLAGLEPEHAKVLIDGREASPDGPDGAFQLEPGNHRVAIAAAGYLTLERDIHIAAGDTLRMEPRLQRREPVAQLARGESRRPEPPRPVESRPALPPNAVDRLQSTMEQGRKLVELQRFLDAALIFGEAADSASAGLGRYRNDEIRLMIALQALLAQGNALHESGSYYQAVQAFRRARDLAKNWRGRVDEPARVQAILDEADQRIGRSRAACEFDRQPGCERIALDDPGSQNR